MGGQKPTQDLPQVNELLVCLFVCQPYPRVSILSCILPKTVILNPNLNSCPNLTYYTPNTNSNTNPIRYNNFTPYMIPYGIQYINLYDNFNTHPRPNIYSRPIIDIIMSTTMSIKEKSHLISY